MSSHGWGVIENMATMATTAGLVLGLYFMGAGAWSFWGLVLLLNMNTFRRVKECERTHDLQKSTNT